MCGRGLSVPGDPRLGPVSESQPGCSDHWQCESPLTSTPPMTRAKALLVKDARDTIRPIRATSPSISAKPND